MLNVPDSHMIDTKLDAAVLAPLLESMLQGDRQAEMTLCSQFYFHHLAQALRNNQDEHLFCEVFHDTWEKVKQQPPDKFPTFARFRDYFKKALKNTETDMFRELARTTQMEHPEELPAVESADAEVLADSQKRFASANAGFKNKPQRDFAIAEAVYHEMTRENWRELFELLDKIRYDEIRQSAFKKWHHSISNKISLLLFDERISDKQWQRLLEKFERHGFRIRQRRKKQ